jgi:thiamine biosynthesis lipoprotein
MKRLLLLSLIFLCGCSQAPTALITTCRPALGTFVEITVADKDKSPRFIHRAIKKAFLEIERIEGLLSKYKTNSDVSRINNYSGRGTTEVNPETITVIARSLEFSRLTKGAFDVTVQPMAAQRAGFTNIKINEQDKSVFLAKPEMTLDLGGIAKGYAVDKAVAILKEERIKSALVNAGGDIYAFGSPQESRSWQTALQHPRKSDAVLTVLEIQDKAIATSGDYQRYVEISGRRYSHIIDPRTGYPCAEIPASVTVLAADCLSADALATSLFVLGPQKGIALVNRLKNTEAIVVSIEQDKLDILLSRGLEGKLEFNCE